MRRVARGTSMWAIAVSLAAVAIGAAQSTSPRRTRPEMPERLGPPIVVAPLDVTLAPPPVHAEVGNNSRPSRPVPGSVSIVMPSERRWLWLPLDPPPCRTSEARHNEHLLGR